MTERFVRYPDAKIVDDAGTEIQHLLWGDFVTVIDGDPDNDPQVRIRSRGSEGLIDSDRLQVERIVEVVFVDVGQGDGALVVTDDDRHVVVDAGPGDNMYRFLRWRYAGFERPWTFDAAVISHPDLDHYAGFSGLFAEPTVHFGAVYHNGLMEERGDNPLGPQEQINQQWYLTGLIEDLDDLQAFLAETERWKGPGDPPRHHWKRYATLLHDLLEGGRVDDVAMLALSGLDAATFVPGFDAASTVQLEVLGPILEDPEGDDSRLLRQYGPVIGSRGRDKGKTKNGNSVILRMRVGDFTLLLGGDLNRPSEHFLLHRFAELDPDEPEDPADDRVRYPYSPARREALVDSGADAFGVDIAKVCHHGSADLTNEMLMAQHATAFVVSSGDEESHAHPRPETLGALGRYGRGDRPLIFSTELLRSSPETNDRHRAEHDDLHERIREAEAAGDHALVDDLEAELAVVEDRIFGRAVATYGAINLRTDGTRVVMAYKLERERFSHGRLTKWDLHRFEPNDEGLLAVVTDDGH